MTTFPTSDPKDTAVGPQDTIGVVEEKEKVCVDCMHLIGVRYKIDVAKGWNCGHEKNHDYWEKDLVTGLKHRIFKIEDIYHVRLNNCKGNWWELYTPPAPKESISIGGSVPVEFDNEELNKNREAAARRLQEVKDRKAGKKLTDTDLKSL